MKTNVLCKKAGFWIFFLSATLGFLEFTGITELGFNSNLYANVHPIQPNCNVLLAKEIRQVPRFYQKIYYTFFGKWDLIGKEILDHNPKAVIIAAPHTSNHDAAAMLAIRSELKLPLYFLIKNSVMKIPLLGRLLKNFGGVGVDRSKNNDQVLFWNRLFANRSELKLVITPEGTRARTDYWKSGFYEIALSAKVPVILSIIDPTPGRRLRPNRMIISEPVYLTGNRKFDMDNIRSVYFKTSQAYKTSGGFHPQKFGPLRLREE